MHELFAAVLSSGSCGNCTLVMHDDMGVLVDAGISCREIELRASTFGVDASQVVAVVLTHEHTDHVRGVRRFCAEHGAHLMATRGTMALAPLEGVKTDVIVPGRKYYLNGLELRPFKVRHLAAEPVAVSFTDGSRKLVVATDMGSITPDVLRETAGAGIMVIEANYDQEMLERGSYPAFLKRAIMSDHGHLSNADAATLVASSASDSTREVVLAHLSKDNNTPELALQTVASRLRGMANGPMVHVAEHGASCGPFHL
ncbi:MAG: MBL fold metallo-hydrolase [Thermoplasmata archaeon]